MPSDDFDNDFGSALVYAFYIVSNHTFSQNAFEIVETKQTTFNHIDRGGYTTNVVGLEVTFSVTIPSIEDVSSRVLLLENCIASSIFGQTMTQKVATLKGHNITMLEVDSFRWIVDSPSGSPTRKVIPSTSNKKSAGLDDDITIVIGVIGGLIVLAITVTFLFRNVHHRKGVIPT